MSHDAGNLIRAVRALSPLYRNCMILTGLSGLLGFVGMLQAVDQKEPYYVLLTALAMILLDISDRYRTDFRTYLEVETNQAYEAIYDGGSSSHEYLSNCLVVMYCSEALLRCGFNTALVTRNAMAVSARIKEHGEELYTHLPLIMGHHIFGALRYARVHLSVSAFLYSIGLVGMPVLAATSGDYIIGLVGAGATINMILHLKSLNMVLTGVSLSHKFLQNPSRNTQALDDHINSYYTDN